MRRSPPWTRSSACATRHPWSCSRPRRRSIFAEVRTSWARAPGASIKRCASWLRFRTGTGPWSGKWPLFPKPLHRDLWAATSLMMGAIRSSILFAGVWKMSAWVFIVLLLVVPVWAQDAPPDRIVAEWILRMGGSVILEGQRRPITDLAGLPTSDFRLHT